MVTYSISSPAKINLHLAIGSKRSDGFHDLQSIFARISLADEITLKAEESDSLRISIHGIEGCCMPGSDTMTKAATIWCKKVGLLLNIDISIDKRIPSEAGMGGGSSNGASVLLALQKMYPSYALEFGQLLELGCQIGSDVPFFLYECRFAYVSGRGEFVKPLNNKGFDSYKILLAKPKQGVSTKGAFSKLDSIEKPKLISSTLLEQYFFSGLDKWKSHFYNDFELVIESEVASLIRYNKSDLFSCMSGSGSTVFAISENQKDLEYLSNIFDEETFVEICSFY